MSIKRLFAKKKRNKLVRAVCRNCGTQLNGAYCHVCGQYLFAGTSNKVGSLVYNALDSIWLIDGKIFSTLTYLIFYPGKLSRDYVDGKITKHVHPSKLFWFISILFFALIASQVDINKMVSVDSNGAEVQKEIVAKDSVTSVAVLPTADKAKSDSVVHGAAKDSNIIDADNKEMVVKTVDRVITYLPYTMFGLIPVLAFMLYVLFRKSVRYYGEHLIFALHLQTFIYVLFGVNILIGKIFPGLSDTLVSFFVLISLVYFMISLYVFYRPRIIPGILKAIFIVISYGLVTAIVIGLLAAIVVITMQDIGWSDTGSINL